MKKKILGVLIPVIVSIMCGYVFGKIVYKIYQEEINDNLHSSKIYLVENGLYDTYTAMREANNTNNYVYYVDSEGYKTVVGITKNYDNIAKIKKIYTSDLSIDEYYMPLEYMNSKQDEYDKILQDKDSVYEIREVVDNILSLYKSDNSIKLISFE